MPYVNIKNTPDGATPEKKSRLIAGVTKLLQDELGKNPETTFVVIDIVDTDNWGFRGKSVTELRKQT
jgi:4-oxalocrotonate tautomerase